jgi:hypothetical protein
MKTIFFYFLILSLNSHASDFMYGELPSGGRENPYNLSATDYISSFKSGRQKAVEAPYPQAEFLIPYYPLERFFYNEGNLFGRLVSSSIKAMINVKDLEEFYDWLGLTKYSSTENPNLPYAIPRPYPKHSISLPLGIAPFHDENNVLGVGFNCMNCHGGQAFGQTIFGLPVRFPRMYNFTSFGDTMMKLSPKGITKTMLKMTDEEFAQFDKAVHLNKFTKTLSPPTIGIDTSLAQVLLAMARRAPDENASLIEGKVRKVPDFISEEFVKASPWWIMKYKNRFLIDGSLVSGHPLEFIILTGELGFGNDLKIYEKWVKDPKNQKTIKEVTTAIFSAKSPKYLDFFPKENINFNSAARGQKVYQNNCAQCHGTYSGEVQGQLKLNYFKNTPVMNVGTKSRFNMMAYTKKELGRLRIYKNKKFKIEAQNGYIPQPLDGIWIRYPYLHNGSVPDLCSLLTHSSRRPKRFYMGEAIDKRLDFDSNCIGFPLDRHTPLKWRKKNYLYDTTRPGHSSEGHNYGVELPSHSKMDLIEFLKLI